MKNERVETYSWILCSVVVVLHTAPAAAAASPVALSPGEL